MSDTSKEDKRTARESSVVVRRSLRYSLMSADDCNIHGHPQQVMKELGITYQHSTPQSIADQWWFWNCENIPDSLPKYLSDLNLNPMECIGWGLCKEDAEKIRDF